MEPFSGKILIAPDSFKGSLTAEEVSAAMAEGVRRVLPGCSLLQIGIADGGEGFVQALLSARGGHTRFLEVPDPLGRRIRAGYEIDGNRAFLEIAAASGLPLLSESERNPLRTSTFGMGILLRDALEQGCRDILIGLGGSATHDAGIGILQALGFRFLDARGKALPPCGESLGAICTIDRSGVLPAVRQARFTAACDVESVFHGKEGAAAVFAPQKGATPDMVRQLDDASARFAALLFRETGIDLQSVPGSGAADGASGTLHALLEARLTPGIELVLEACRFDELLRGAALVLTGEGCLDAQTLRGKAVSGILRHAGAAGVPVIAIGGRLKRCPELEALPRCSLIALSDTQIPDRIAMQPDYTRECIIKRVGEILRQNGYCTNELK